MKPSKCWLRSFSARNSTDQGRLIGKCVYENKGDHWIITTTKVDPAYDGHGLGRQLVDAVVVAA